MMNHPRISVIMPICGGAERLGPLLDSLRSQTVQPDEIIVVDNAPTAAHDVPEGLRYVWNQGIRTLSGNYNLGVEHATGDLVLLTQQDCWPAHSMTLEGLLKEFKVTAGDDSHQDEFQSLKKPSPVVAATALVRLPEAVFQSYGFWGKVLMARWVGTTQQGISGKFDLVRRDVFEKIGGYDCEHFQFAGEDIDLCVRLSEEGRVVVTDSEVIHHHHQGNETSAYYVLGKHYMNAEGFGVGLRRHGLNIARVPYAKRWTHHLNKFFYPLLLAVPCWPLVSLAVLTVVANIAQFQSFRAGTLRMPILVLFNPVIFLVGFTGTLVGFLRGRQVFRP